jgi:signal transduction histidine kinase
MKDKFRTDPEQESNRINESLDILYEVTGGIRQVMDDLRPAILDDYGLYAALSWYTDNFQERTEIKAVLKGKELNPRLDQKKEIALFRIAQEALTNITRHAQASQVELKLSATKNWVTLTITDDGIGFDPLNIEAKEGNRGWGLINMKERAARVGGTMDIQAQPQQGTTLLIKIPRN